MNVPWIYCRTDEENSSLLASQRHLSKGLMQVCFSLIFSIYCFILRKWRYRVNKKRRFFFTLSTVVRPLFRPFTITQRWRVFAFYGLTPCLNISQLKSTENHSMSVLFLATFQYIYMYNYIKHLLNIHYPHQQWFILLLAFTDRYNWYIN